MLSQQGKEKKKGNILKAIPESTSSRSRLENMFKTDEFRRLRRPVKTLRKRRTLRAQQTRFGHGNKNEKEKSMCH